MDNKQENRFYLAGLWSVLTLGFILRIYGLDSKVIWFDEACSLAYTQQNWSSYLRDYFNFKPFCFSLLKIWLGFFGTSAFSARFLSVIFGTLSIYFIYEVGRRLFNKEVGLFSAFLLSISCFHIYHSQQVRHMTLITLLWLISYLLCSKIFFGKKITKAQVLLNSAINILSIYSHPYGLALPICQNIFFITQRKKISEGRGIWYSGQAIILLFLFLWLLIPDQQKYINDMIWWIPHWSPRIILETFETFSFGGPRYGLDDFKINIWYLYFTGYILLLLYALLLLSAIIPNNKNKAVFEYQSPKKIFLLTWLFCPILLATLLSFYKPIYLIKQLIYILPAFYLFVGLGFSKIKQIRLKISLFFLVIITSVFPLYIMYANDFNIDWRSPAAYVRENMKEKDTIIISNLTEIVTFMYYFDNKSPMPLRNIGIYGKSIDSRWHSIFNSGGHCIIGIGGDRRLGSEKMMEDFDSKVSCGQFLWLSNNIWLVSSRWAKEGAVNHMNGFFLKNNYKLHSRKTFRGVEVLYFLKH